MRALSALFVAFATLLFVLGCGGGGNPTASAPATRGGSATIRIDWPKVSRLIPSVTRSVRVTLSTDADPSVFEAEEIIPRPSDGSSSKKTFTGLKPGSYRVRAVAYGVAKEDVNAGSISLADGSSVLTIVADNEARFSITMESTISRFLITGFPGIAAFYLTANGAVDENLTPIVPEYPFGEKGVSTLSITPQSKVGAGYSNLTLIPDAATIGQSTITAAITSPLVQTSLAKKDNQTISLGVQLPESAGEGPSNLSVTYRDGATGALTDVLSYQTAVLVSSTPSQGVTPTASNLPLGRVDGLYRVRGLLEDQSISSNKETQDVLASKASSAVRFNFQGIYRTANNFRLTATLQIKTANGDYVNVKRVVVPGLTFDEVRNRDIFFDKLTTGNPGTGASTELFLPTPTTFKVIRGSAGVVVSTVSAQVGPSSDRKTVDLPASLFDFENVEVDNGDDSRFKINPVYDQDAQRWTLVPPSEPIGPKGQSGSGTFKVKLYNDSTVRGTFNYDLVPAGGGIEVGIG